MPTDVRSHDAFKALADAAIEQFGTVDVVHNNAGVVAAGLIDELSMETWRWVLDVDLWSVIWVRPDLGGLTVTLERIGDGAGTPRNAFRRPVPPA